MAEYQKFLISRAKAGQSYADVIRALSDEDKATLLRILYDSGDPSLAWCNDEASAAAHCLDDDCNVRNDITDDMCALCTLRFIKQVPVV